jgi:hypothetical protein
MEAEEIVQLSLRGWGDRSGQRRIAESRCAWSIHVCTFRLTALSPADRIARTFTSSPIHRKMTSTPGSILNTSHSWTRPRCLWTRPTGTQNVPSCSSGTLCVLGDRVTVVGHAVKLTMSSAGFDACEHEHQAMQRHDRRVPVSFFSRYTRDIAAFADTHCRGRVVSVLEGGYSDRALTSAAMGHVVGMLGQEGKGEWWDNENIDQASLARANHLCSKTGVDD